MNKIRNIITGLILGVAAITVCGCVPRAYVGVEAEPAGYYHPGYYYEEPYYFEGYYTGPYWYWHDRDGHWYHELREEHERHEREGRHRDGRDRR